MAGKRKGCLIVVLVLVALVVGLVCFLPALLSLKPVSSFVFSRVKAASGDTVSIENWSLGWFSGVKVEGIKFADKASGAAVEVASIDMPTGILSMLRGATKNFGRVQIVEPRACITLPAPGAAGAKAKAAAAKPSPKKAPAGPPKPVKIPVDVAGSVEIRNGSVQVKGPDGAALDVSGLNVTVTIESLGKPIKFNVAARVADGDVELAGSTTLLTGGVLDPERVAADVALKIKSLQLAAATAPFASLPGMPRVSGALSVDFNAAVRGSKDVAASGKIGLQSLALSGGPLGEDKPSFDSITVDLQCALKDNSVKVERFSLTSPVMTATASGVLGLPAAGQLPSCAFESQAHVNIPAIASRFSHTMKLQEGLAINGGSVDFKGRVESSGKKQTANISLAVQDLAAVMGGRNIAMAEPIMLKARASKDGEDIQVEDVTLTSSFARAKVAGTPKQVKIEMEADIAAALAEVRKFVDVPADLNVEGKANLSADIAMAGKAVSVSSSLALNGLAATVKGQRGVMSAPVLLNFKVAKDGENIRIDDVSLSSSFAKAKVSGTQKELKIEAAVDLGTAMTEARKFVVMPADMGVEGQAQLSALLGIEGENITVSSSLALNGLAGTVKGQRGELAAPILLNCKVAKQGKAVTIENLVFSSSFAKAKISGTQKELKIDASANIGTALAEARKFVVLPPDINVEGQAEFSAVLGMSDETVAVSSSLALNGLAGTVKGRRGELAAPVLLNCKAEKKGKAVLVENLSLSSSFAKAKITGSQKEMKIEASADIAAALSEARKLVDLPADLKVAGQASMSAAIAADEHTVKISSAGLDVASFVFESAGKKMAEKLLHAGIECEIDLDKKGVTLESAELSSSPLTVTAAGSFMNWDTTKDLDAKGQLACDVGRMTEIASSMSGMKITGAGKKAEPFRIKTSLQGKKWTEIVKKTDMTAALYAEKIEAFGVNVGETHVPLTARNGVVQLRIESTVNEGKVLVAPIIDARGEPPVLTMAPDSRLLDGVSITDGMVDNILVRIHPFFAACLITSGKMSLDMKKLRVPLNDQITKSAAFEGQISLAALTFKASGLLDQIIGLMGEDVRDATTLGDMAFAFACRDGRIYPDPLKIKMGKYKLVFRGSVGLDQSLDYYVDIPITKQMAPGNAYEYLKDECITVPIGGTASKPKLAEDAVQKILGDLVKKAATKAAENEVEKQAGKLINGLFK